MMHPLARLWNLLRGAFARWIGRREHANPEAVYETAIQERHAQYGQLRQAAAGVLYLRSKLAKELERESSELALIKRQLDVALDRDDDAVALTLIGRRNRLAADVERLTAELTELTQEAESAKQNLIAFQDDIARLKEERVRMLARLANAKARLRFQTTLNGLSPDADIRALDEVREHINRLVAETQIGRDVGDRDLSARLDRIREAEAESSARAQLEEMKRTRKPALLPMVLPQQGLDGAAVHAKAPAARVGATG
jgi:phage shock protein A